MTARATARSTGASARTAATGRAGTAARTGTTTRTGTATRTAKRTPTPATRTATATPRPELRLVPGTAPSRTRRQVPAALRHRRAPFVLLVVALLAGTTLGLLILNTAIAVDSLEATQLRAENAERAQEVQRLEQQVVSAGTPAEIARAAEEAGLVPAGPAGHLVIGPDGGTVLRGTPTPAEDPNATEDEDED